MNIGHFQLNNEYLFSVLAGRLRGLCEDGNAEQNLQYSLDILFCFHFNWKGVRHPVMTVPILDLAGRMINLLLSTKYSIGAVTCLYNAVSYRTRNAMISQSQRRP